MFLVGCVGQIDRQLVSPTADSLFIQACNQRELPVTGTISRFRDGAHIPAPLWLIQAAQEQVDLLMVPQGGRIATGLAHIALALMNRRSRFTHGR